MKVVGIRIIYEEKLKSPKNETDSMGVGSTMKISKNLPRNEANSGSHIYPGDTGRNPHGQKLDPK